jgi:hypothetical protein
LQILHHVEAGVLAQQCVAQERNEIGGPMTGGKVGCREPCCFRDLLLAVAGIEEGAAKLLRSTSVESPCDRRAGGTLR